MSALLMETNNNNMRQLLELTVGTKQSCGKFKDSNTNTVDTVQTDNVIMAQFL